VKEGYVLKADAAKYLTPEPITYAAMKRKSEKAAQNALEDARASVMRAAGIGKVEAYCINTVLAELKRKGFSPEQEEYKRISRETARMKTKELIEYLQGFDAESEVLVITANPKERKKYDGKMFGITDGGQPIFCVEVSNESDLDEEEIAAAVQDERKAEQE
jgi:hypothetical protein